MKKEKDLETEVNPVNEAERISNDDYHLLETSEMNCKVSRLESEKAVLQQQVSELSYRFIVAQLYIKYKLLPTDAITNEGVIVRNGKKNES